MKKRIYRVLIAFVLCIAMAVPALSSGISADDEFMIRAVAAEYPQLELAARVGILAVIKNRVKSEFFPDTAAGVISAYREDSGKLRFRNTGALRVDEVNPKSYRMTRDAYALVAAGADPTSGALDFDILEKVQREYDLNFDDQSEIAYEREIARAAAEYKLVIDGVGFK